MSFQNKLGQYGIGTAFVLAVLVVQYKFITEGPSLSSVLLSLAALLPFMIAAMLAASGIWAGLLLGLLNIGFAIPAPVLRHLKLGLLLTLLLAGLSLLRWLKGDLKNLVFRSPGERCLGIVAVGIMLRILWDRPGSANLGESGGAGESIFYLAGGLAFMVASASISKQWNIRKNIVIITVLSVLGVVEGIVVLLLNDKTSILSTLFGQPAWFLAPMALAWIHEYWNRRSSLRNWAAYYCLVSIICVLAAVTPFRSRPAFALAQIILVALVYRHLRRTVLVLILALSVGIGMATVFGQGGIPRIAKRSLSTVLNVDRTEAYDLSADFGTSAEFGWSSGFRATLNRLALANIREHPVMGKGFKFSAAELSAAQGMLSEDGLGPGQLALALAGVYHNCLLSLAVFCGIPIALLFVIGWASVCRQCFVSIRQVNNPHWRRLGAALLAFMAAITGQMLMNGGGDTFLAVMACLGVMNGMTNRINSGTETDLQMRTDITGS